MRTITIAAIVLTVVAIILSATLLLSTQKTPTRTTLTHITTYTSTKEICIGKVCLKYNITRIGNKTYAEFRDLSGQIVRVRIPIRRVVLIDGCHKGILIAIDAIGGRNALKKIVGMDVKYCERSRRWIWSKYTNALPWLKSITDVGTSKDLDVELILKLKPDVVIATLSDKPRLGTIMLRFEKVGIPVVFIDYHAETWEHHALSTLILGLLFNKTERALEVLRWYKSRLDLIEQRLKQIRHRVKVYIEAGWGTWTTYGDYMWGRLVELAGGINIAKSKVRRIGKLDPEYILKENPDVIIITCSYWATRPGTVWCGYYANVSLVRERLLNRIKRPGWCNLNALRECRVLTIHHQLARTIWDIVAIEFFAKEFYPQLFKDLDPVRDFIEFHRRFLSVNYSGVWMYALNVSDCKLICSGSS